MSVVDWEIGAQVWGELVAVRDLQLRPAGTNRPQTSFTVFDASGSRTATSWELPESQVEVVVAASKQSPPLLRVSGSVEAKEKYLGQLKIAGVTPASPDELADANPTDFLEALPLDHEQLVAGLDRLIQHVKHPQLSALLARTIGSRGTLRTAFVQASAAKRNHHAYPGGLLRHSLEVTEVALLTAGRFSGLNRDMLIAAGLLHDIGKVFEMDHAWERGSYTDAGNLLGHIYIGAERIGAICRGLKFPERMQQALLHVILAHHDEEQFGSPIRPKTAEAIAIAKSDQISAELDAFFKAKRDAAGDQRTVNQGGRFLFVGDVDYGFAESANPERRPSLTDCENPPVFPKSKMATSFQNFAIAASLPILGVVAAGDGVRSSSIEDEPDMRETILPPAGADFLLRVSGDSMVGAGVIPDDLLVVRSQETARIGQIVVAQIPGTGAVVKRLTETAEGRFLASENPAYEPIKVDEDIRIQGIVVRVERDLD